MKTTMDREGRETNELVEGRPRAFFLVRPATLLRAEGMTMLIGSVLLYWLYGGSWWLFFLLLLVPDASMLGYLGGPRFGAVAYNAFHSYPLPAVLAASVSWAGFLWPWSWPWCGSPTSAWTVRSATG